MRVKPECKEEEDHFEFIPLWMTSGRYFEPLNDYFWHRNRIRSEN